MRTYLVRSNLCPRQPAPSAAGRNKVTKTRGHPLKPSSKGRLIQLTFRAQLHLPLHTILGSEACNSSLSRSSYRSRLVSASCLGRLVSVVLSQSSCLRRLGGLASVVLSRSSCLSRLVSVVLSRSSCPGRLIPVVLSRSSCLIVCLSRLVPVVLSRSICLSNLVSVVWSSFLCRQVSVVLSRSSYLSRLVSVVLSSSSRLGRLVSVVIDRLVTVVLSQSFRSSCLGLTYSLRDGAKVSQSRPTVQETAKSNCYIKTN